MTVDPSAVDVFVVLANSAEVDPTGRVHMIGGGWSLLRQGEGRAPFAVVVFAMLAWDQRPVPFDMSLELVDGDGRVVSADVPGGRAPMEISIQNGMPTPDPQLPPGTPVDLPPVAVNVPAVDLEPGRYEWKVAVDGFSDPRWSRSFTVVPAVAAHGR